MLAEVIPQVAAFAEHGHAAGVLAAEVELALFILGVDYFNDIMPVIRDSFKVFDVHLGLPTFLRFLLRYVGHLFIMRVIVGRTLVLVLC